MTDVYIICSDGVFRRMLELELTEYGANVMPEGSAITAPCAVLISAPDIDRAVLPQDDGCLTVIFGYSEELSDVSAANPSAVLVRPFDTDELMRVLFGESKAQSVPAIRRITAACRLTTNIEKRTVSYLGATSHLTRREFALFEYLYKRKGEEISRSEIFDNVWGGGGGESVVDVYVCYLREKLEDAFGIRFIRTIRGKGYMFEK